MTDEKATRIATAVVFGTKNAINALFVLPLIAWAAYVLRTAQQFSDPTYQLAHTGMGITSLIGGWGCLILLYRRRKSQHGILSELIFVLFFSQAVNYWLIPAENQAQQNIRIAYLLIATGLLLSVVKEWWGRRKDAIASSEPSSTEKEGHHA